MPLNGKEKAELDYIERRYFTYDDPVPFCGLKIYPVTMRDHDEFLRVVDCFLLNKNDDIKGLKMTPLEYMLSKTDDEKDGPMWSYKLSVLIKLCFHVEPGFKCHKCGKFISYPEYIAMLQNINTQEDADKLGTCPNCPGEHLVPSLTKEEGENKRMVLVIDGHKVTNSDFTLLKMIVLRQNLPDYKDDSGLSKELREDQAKRAEILSKDKGTANTERKMMCLSVATGYPLDKIYDLTMRKFDQMLSITNDLTEYKIAKQGLMSGMVKLKDGETIDHWMYKKERNLLEGVVDADSFAQKIKSNGM